MNNTAKPYQFLNRDVIKYIAIIAMLLNHISVFFGMELALTNRSLLFLFDDVGKITAITMIFFLVEGYYYTHSKQKYITRLLIFAFISQIAWNFAFAPEGQIWSMGGKLNMIFTLCICFGVIYVLDTEKNWFIKVALVLLGIYLSQYCDWPWLAPLYTVAFVWGRKNRMCQILAGIICWAMFMIDTVIELAPQVEGGVVASIKLGLSSSVYLVVALVLVLFLYNGKQMKCGRAFSKWFFYIFYPTHLVILRIIDILVHGL